LQTSEAELEHEPKYESPNYTLAFNPSRFNLKNDKLTVWHAVELPRASTQQYSSQDLSHRMILFPLCLFIRAVCPPPNYIRPPPVTRNPQKSDVHPLCCSIPYEPTYLRSKPDTDPEFEQYQLLVT